MKSIDLKVFRGTKTTSNINKSVIIV